MEIVVVDGQGGGIGRSIIEAVKAQYPECFVIAVGTNTSATTNMRKGGADVMATGTNAIIYNVTRARIVIGPIGIAFANSMYGEISPEVAAAVSSSEADCYFIPIMKSKVRVAGVVMKTIPEYIDEIVNELKKYETPSA
ncbi:MAG: DUF3842 family protein [bacterium]